MLLESLAPPLAPLVVKLQHDLKLVLFTKLQVLAVIAFKQEILMVAHKRHWEVGEREEGWGEKERKDGERKRGRMGREREEGWGG